MWEISLIVGTTNHFIVSYYDKNTFTVIFKKSNWVLFASSIMKNIVTLSSSRFPVQLICVTLFRSASSFCCLLKSIAVNL